MMSICCKHSALQQPWDLSINNGCQQRPISTAGITALHSDEACQGSVWHCQQLLSLCTLSRQCPLIFDCQS